MIPSLAAPLSRRDDGIKGQTNIQSDPPFLVDNGDAIFAARGLEELFFQLCCSVSFLFWREIGFGCTYLRTLLNKLFYELIFF